MKSKLSRRRFLATAAATVVPAAIAQASPRVAGALNSLAAAAPDSPAGTWKDAGVIDVSRSPYAKLKTVPVRAVEIREGFWSKRRVTNIESSIPSMHDELVDHGRMNNFLRLEGRSSAPQIGPVYSDSDIYKWAEAVGFALQTADHSQLRSTTLEMIHQVVATQEPSGYIDTYYQDGRKPLRMLYETQTTGHELYCLGHMLQGAIAIYRATGDRTLLDAGIRMVDDFLLPNYGPGANQKGIVAGHPEIEMSLIELYRTTGKRAYVDLAGYILHGDERIPLRPQQIVYMFCGIPFTSRTHLEGHAVRAMYACCGATDYYLETGDPAYWKTLNTLWEDLVHDQLYVTGGVGARETGEAFGDPYELPNARAYGESCAAIGVMMWNWRMLTASGDARFTDVIERSLYNGINSGMSLDGRTYCYRNPLAFDPEGDSSDRHAPEGRIRNPWYDTTCCPPNLERTFASLPGYFYGTSDDGVYVHLYDNSAIDWRLGDGRRFRIEQTTRYPWEGNVRIAVDPATPSEFTLHVRIPGWSQQTSVRVNGTDQSGIQPGKYLPIHRRWSAGDVVELNFDMSTRLLKANPAVNEDRGRVAFQRGPIVFCMEMLDQPDVTRAPSIVGYTAHLDDTTVPHYAPDLLDGVMVLEHPGSVASVVADTSLYFSGTDNHKAAESPTTLRLIPYYAWDNREPSSMQVWIPFQVG
ncbi:conserved exported hypothetical protein [Candidatus Sulfotelmatomonas gaucii]|uniref:Glycoside hydrolase family 127 protein n=1 Tax=Candidatus Sulfuritelmatomonas gaucii TaxID=2043161 RepID=A0A2N9LM93_9BACT|nr:conserved exported hypothetical protein [Candidatus Sulfotelmatomonas gaucii]